MESLRLENIKAFKDSGELELAPITVLVGRNSCGKSSLVRFPAVLAQTANAYADSPLAFYGNMVDYGTYDDVVYKHNQGEAMSYTINYEYDFNDLIYSYVARQRMRLRNRSNIPRRKRGKNCKKIAIKVTVEKKDKKIVLKTLSIFIDNDMLCTVTAMAYSKYRFQIQKSYSENEFVEDDFKFLVKPVKKSFFSMPMFTSLDIIDAVLQDNKEDLNIEKENEVGLNEFIAGLLFDTEDDLNISLSEEVAKVKLQAETAVLYSLLIKKFAEKLYEDVSAIKYIGPFRTNPKRIYRDPEYDNKDVGVHGENVSTFLIHDSYENKDLINNVSNWLNATLGYNLDVKDIGNGLFQIVVVDGNGIEANIIDTGYGISQILPIVTQLMHSCFIKKRRVSYNSFLSGDKELIVLEQPELHLHPAAQEVLADLFVNCVVNAKNIDNNINILCETHSEHFIRKLQVLIADRNCDFNNNMIKIYYVDKDQKGDASIREMRIAENGQLLDEWPKGFFDNAYELTMQLLEKSSER